MNPDRTEPASGYSPARDGRQSPAQNPPGGILLPFPPGCVQGTLLRRVKRFSLDFRLRGSLHRAHTNNSGAMLGLVREGLSVWLSPASGPGRKSAYTLEMIRLPAFPEDFWVGVNTLTPNRLLRAAFAARLLPWASGYTVFRPEARRGSSRLDALLTGPDLPPLWVECKNVTLVEDDMAAFPDAVSLRGRKHLEEMTAIAASGERAAFFYCVQRPDGRCFGPADYVDAAYAGLYFQALEAGVEVYPHRALLSPRGIGLGALLPLAGPPELST